MKYWFADDSEFNSTTHSHHSDVFVFGGIVIADDELDKLRKTIEDIKALYAHSRAPVKWNFKSLKKTYQNHDLEDSYFSLLQCSEALRKEIFEAVSEIDFQIIVSAIETVIDNPKERKKKKSELSSFAFVMGLMRFGMELQKTEDEGTIVLDWPDKGDNLLFNKEYAHAYTKGKSSSGLDYLCGPLNKLKFNDSVYYTTMVHSTALQLADMVVGVTKDYLEGLNKPKKQNDFKEEMFEMIFPKFRGYPEILNKGLIISNNSPNLKKRVQQQIGTRQLQR